MKVRNRFLIATIILLSIGVVLSISIIGANILFTGMAEEANKACVGQSFESVEAALKAYEDEVRGMEFLDDEEQDVFPPFRLVYQFEYEGNIIIFYKYCIALDGDERIANVGIRVLRKTENGKYYFESGCAFFNLFEPSDTFTSYTNIETSKGTKSINFIYLDKDNQKDVYVNDVKATKVLVTIDEQEFYLCYALSKKDTIFSLLFLNKKRHIIAIK